MTFYGQDVKVIDPPRTRPLRTFAYTLFNNGMEHEVSANDIYFYDAGRVGFWNSDPRARHQNLHHQRGDQQVSQNNHEQAVYALMAPAIMKPPNDPHVDGTPWPPSEHNIESAKVWATMAAAYEQRTANLIAFHTALRDRKDNLAALEVLTEIKERLGIE